MSAHVWIVQMAMVDRRGDVMRWHWGPYHREADARRAWAKARSNWHPRHVGVELVMRPHRCCVWPWWRPALRKAARA